MVRPNEIRLLGEVMVDMTTHAAEAAARHSNVQKGFSVMAKDKLPRSAAVKKSGLKTLQDAAGKKTEAGKVPQSVLLGQLPSERRIWTQDEIAAYVDAFEQQMPAEYREYLRQETTANQIEAELGVEMDRFASRLFPEANSIDTIWLIGEVRGYVRKKLNLEK